MNKAFDSVTDTLTPYLSIYGVILVFVVVYLLFDASMHRITKKQQERKKNVIKRMDTLKEPYRQKEEIAKDKQIMSEKVYRFFDKLKSLPFEMEGLERMKQIFAHLIAGNAWIEALRFEKFLTKDELDHVRTESYRIIKEEKSRAFVTFLNFSLRVVVFILFLHYFYTIDVIPQSLTLVFITTIVSYFAILTRKTAFIFLIIAIISFFVYRHFSGAACIFILEYWIIKGIKHHTKAYIKRRKKEEDN